MAYIGLIDRPREAAAAPGDETKAKAKAKPAATEKGVARPAKKKAAA